MLEPLGVAAPKTPKRNHRQEAKPLNLSKLKLTLFVHPNVLMIKYIDTMWHKNNMLKTDNDVH